MNFDIGITGLRTAQRALELIGTNIANASAEGYHRQDPKIVPLDLTGPGGGSMGGSALQGTIRRIDVLLEQERVRQQPLYGQVSQELEVLKVVESILGDLDTRGLAQAVDAFFNSLNELAANPTSQPYQQAVVSAAEGMAGQFNNVSRLLTDLGHNVLVQARDTCGQINHLVAEVAGLNLQMATSQTQGNSPNDLYDRRDQALYELGQLVDVHVQQIMGSEAVNVESNELPLVTNVTAHPLEVAIVEDNQLAIRRQDSQYYVTDITGGRLGGLMTLKNQILPEIARQLDSLAGSITGEVNRIHVQGVGTAGSFTELTGQPVPAAAAAQWDSGVVDGEIQLRLIDSAGAFRVYHVGVDADTDTLATTAAKLSALDPAHFSAHVIDSSLRLQAVPGWEFDFLPAVQIDAAGLTGTSALSTQGVYGGTTNQTFTARVIGGGQVGLTAGLQVELLDGDGARAALLNVGQGYPPGEYIQAADGLRIALSAGTLLAGQQAAISAVADSDTSGFLAAAGINTMFAGSTAGTIRVTDLVRSNPRRLAHAGTEGGFDNLNVQRLAQAGRTALDDLDGNSAIDYAQQVVGDVAQSISGRQSRLEALQGVMQQLDLQRDDVSGVDINDEASKLLLFERMFQSMAKFLNVQDQAMQSLMEVL